MKFLLCWFLTTVAAQPGTVPLGDWPHEFNDSANSGVSNGGVGGNVENNSTVPIYPGGTPKVVWSTAIATDSAITGGVSIDVDHNVFAGSPDGVLLKINGSDGSEVWRYEAGAAISSTPWLDSLWDDVSTAYFGDQAGRFHAVLAESGEPKFEKPPFESERPITTSPYVRNHIAISGTTAYYSSGSQLLALNVRTWDLRFNYTLPSSIAKIEAPSYGYCSMFVALSNGTLLNLNPHRFPGYPVTPDDACCQDLEPIKWAHQAAGPASAAPSNDVSVSGGFVNSPYVVTEAGTIEKLNADTGSAEWVTALPGAIRATPTVPFTPQSPEVLVGATDGVLYCLDGNDGSIIWSFEAPAPIENSVVIDAEGKIFLPVSNGQLYALSPEGKQLAVFNGADAITTNLAISALGQIVFGDAAGRINAVSFV